VLSRIVNRRIVPSAVLWAVLVSVSGGFCPSFAHPAIDDQIAALNARIANDPEDATLYLRRGELHRIHRDWTAAESDYARALALNPELLTARMSLGRMKLESGNPKAALIDLDAYLASRPKDPAALVARARSLEKLGRHLEAADAFDRAIAASEAERPRPEYYLERARALAAAGPEQVDRALRGLDQGLARLGQPVTLQNFAIELELDRKQYDRALSRLDAMWAGSQRRETWALRRGEILEVAGRKEDAQKAYALTLKSIEELTPARRENRAVQQLERQAREGMKRTSSANGEPSADGGA